MTAIYANKGGKRRCRDHRNDIPKFFYQPGIRSYRGSPSLPPDCFLTMRPAEDIGYHNKKSQKNTIRLKKLMDDQDQEKSAVEKAGEDLFNFAVDREDVHELMDQLPESADIEATAVEYELPLLKIITVGWSVAYLLENSTHKKPLMEVFWNAVQQFSNSLSETAGLMTGQDINYFDVVKQRFDTYLAAMNSNPEARDPAAVIGPEFAGICGNADEVFTALIGSRMFVGTVNCVKEYLKAFSII